MQKRTNQDYIVDVNEKEYRNHTLVHPYIQQPKLDHLVEVKRTRWDYLSDVNEMEFPNQTHVMTQAKETEWKYLI